MTAPTDHVELTIGGMTCASCAARIERKLNKLDGVTGDGQLRHREGQGRVPGGHGAARPGGRWSRPPATPPSCRSAPTPAADADDGAGDPIRVLRRRLIAAVALAVPVIVLAMVPALQFTYWQWLSLVLATPVVAWGALAVPPAALDQPAARHRHDGHADLAGRLRGVRLVAVRAVPRRRRHAGHDRRLPARPPIRRPVAARSTSRSPPASPPSSWPAGTSRRAPSGAPAPRCGRCWSSARRTSRCCATAASSRIPVERAGASATSSWCAPARRSPPTAWSSRAARRSTPRMLTGESVPVEVGERRRGGRRDGQRRRPAGGARDPGRRGHPAGADGAAGRGRAERQGRGAAAGRPDRPRCSCRS